MNSRQKIIVYTALIYVLILISAVIFNQQMLIQAKLTGQSPVSQQQGLGYVFYVLASVVIANIIIIALSVKYKRLIGIFFNLYVMFAMIISIMMLADIYLFWLTPLGVLASIVIISSVLLYLYLNKRTHNKYFNVFGIIMAVGIGTMMSVSVSTLVALVLLVCLSIYDYIAVFITKNMLRLMEIVGTNALPMFIVAGDIGTLQKRTANVYCNNCRDKMHEVLNVNDIETKAKHLKCDNCGREVYVNHKDANDEIKVVYAGNSDAIKKPKPDVSALGLGDLIIPSILIGSLAINFNIWWGVAGLIGAVIGMLGNMFILDKLKRPLPALPLICVGMLCAFGIMWVL